MAYGFYITQRGLEKITQASNTDSKVVINQYLVGDGGDLEGEANPAITGLNNELYRKSLTDLDSFEISGSKILIKTVLPDDVPAMTFNEAGYLDTDDELIIYGTFRPITKNASNPEAPQIIEHDNYVEFTANQIDSVTISTGNQAYDSLVERITAVENDKASKTDLETLKQTINNDISNNLTQVSNSVSDLEKRVQTLETTLNGVAEYLERIS